MVRALLVVTPLVFLATFVQGRTLRHEESYVTMCVKRRRQRRGPRYIRRYVRRERVDRIVARGGGYIGDPVPGMERGYIFGNRCRPIFDESLVVEEPPPPVDYDCDQCPCGYYDGCNFCDCGSPPISGPGKCGDQFCETWFEPRCDPCPACTEDAYTCPDGTVLSRDQYNDCEFPPCPMFPPPPTSQCCDPYSKPSSRVCFEGIQCCPNTGEWSCSIGDGTTYVCGDITITGNYGEPCGCPEDLKMCPDGSFVKRDPYNYCEFAPCDGSPPGPPTQCCNPLERPGEFGNPICFEGAACCPDGTWSCSIGDGRSFPCGGEIITSGFGQECALDCESCPGGFYDGCNNCGCDGDSSIPFCTLRACGPGEFEPRTCNQNIPGETCCDPQERPGFGDNFFCSDGVTCCEDCCKWSCGIGDGTFGCDATCNSNVVVEINCDTCECGYNDGCNDCKCKLDGTVECTEWYCVWEGIPQCLECMQCPADVQSCPDGSFVSRDPNLDCAFPPCPEQPPPTEFCTADVQSCPDGSFVSRDPNLGCAFPECPTCCDPQERPGFCSDGVVCCEECCTWSCGIGDGSFGCESVCNPYN